MARGKLDCLESKKKIFNVGEGKGSEKEIIDADFESTAAPKEKRLLLASVVVASWLQVLM